MDTYRPSCLLNSTYKLYAFILQGGLTKGLNHLLPENPFRFRKAKSTSHAIYLVRRLMRILDKSEAKGHILLLDWRKASDTILLQRLPQILTSHGTLEEPITAITSALQIARFCVEHGHEAEMHRQERDIRQGCPLSPYLFLAMQSAVLMEATGQTTERQWARGHIAQVPYHGLLLRRRCGYQYQKRSAGTTLSGMPGKYCRNIPIDVEQGQLRIHQIHQRKRRPQSPVPGRHGNRAPPSGNLPEDHTTEKTNMA